MEAIRKIYDDAPEEVRFYLPPALQHRRVEVLVLALDEGVPTMRPQKLERTVWDAIQAFRNRLEVGDLEPDEDVFARVRDRSPGRKVSL